MIADALRIRWRSFELEQRHVAQLLPRRIAIWHAVRILIHDVGGQRRAVVAAWVAQGGGG